MVLQFSKQGLMGVLNEPISPLSGHPHTSIYTGAKKQPQMCWDVPELLSDTSSCIQKEFFGYVAWSGGVRSLST